MEIKINIANLQDYVQHGKQKDFAMFLYLKTKYSPKKSCFFEYTPEKLAADIGVCRNTADAYIKRFISYGWVRSASCKMGRYTKERKINLTFISPRKFQDNNKKGLLRDFKIEGDYKNIEDCLYLILLKHKQHQFDSKKKLAQDIKAPGNLTAYKKALKLITKKNYSANQLPDQNAKFQASVKKIAEWFNCSVGKASQILTRFKNQGLIIVESCRQVLAKTTDKHKISALLNHYPNSFYTGKYVIKVSCNCYKF